VRGLKILVIVMGVMLVTGFAALIIVIAGRLSHNGPARPFAAAPIELPAGARIETIGVGSDRLVLAIVLPDGEHRLMIVDPATGHLLVAIPVHIAP
jgi:uncharacterized protein DUF6476